MGKCPSQAERDERRQLVQIQLPAKPKKEPVQVEAVEDQWCMECDKKATHQASSTWHHRCNPKRKIEFQEQREAICGKCDDNIDGVCMVFRAIETDPDKPCSVEFACKNAFVACPKEKFGRLQILCPKCECRLNGDGAEPKSCHYCGASWSGQWHERQQESLDEHCIAVTSLSLLPHHRNRQTVCLDSWKQHGLSIVALNRSDEIGELASVYPQVSQWIVNNERHTDYPRPTQRIRDLANVAVTLNRTVLLINSDIEIYGDQSKLIEPLKAGEQIVGIRWNYTGGNYGTAKMEEWGLDAFSFTPERAKKLPEIPLAIGRPIWDYWLPKHSREVGQPMHFIGEPFFYHAAHALHWSQEDWDNGEKWVREHYGEGFPASGVPFRQSLPFPPESP